MSDTSIPVGEHRRKRVRKGTRSCWECKRRKIKCVYQSADHSVCVGCLDKGTTCLSQEYVDDQLPRSAEEPSVLGQRMEKVEMLLEKLMERITTEETHRQVDALTPSMTPATTDNSEAPFVTYGNAQQRTEANRPIRPPQSILISNSNTSANAGNGNPIERTEELRRRLASMLPCQEDIDYLLSTSQNWWLIRRHVMPYLLEIPEGDNQNPFDVSIVLTGHPMNIARLLLCVALCIQQLPPIIDLRRLQIKIPLSEMMEQIITFITATVISDDELIGSIEGIECLLLHGAYQLNAGNLRRSWLAFRRAINVAQLMGFHRAPLKISHEAPDFNERKRNHIWHQIMRGDRYLSLMLGVPSATGSAAYPFHENAPWISTEDRYNNHLCNISGLILARNQGDSVHAFSTTQEIDEKLYSLAKQMPQSWWEIPSVVKEDRTEEAANQFEQLMCQIWHFELETLVHLPFMLRATTERRYEYSRISCLSASRGLIKRWMFMRLSYSTTFVNCLIEFQAFTSVITLLLGLLGSTNTTDPVVLKERYDDLQLVESVVQILEGLKVYGSGLQLVNQSVSAIRTLQNVLRNKGNLSNNIRLAIPHFGTISVARSGTVQSLEGERMMGANPRSDIASMEVNPPVQAERSNMAAGVGAPWNSLSAPRSQEYQYASGNLTAMNYNDVAMKNSVLQFTSSQFPMFEAQEMCSDATECSFQESDTMLFDGLFNTDVEGNWNWGC